MIDPDAGSISRMRPVLLTTITYCFSPIRTGKFNSSYFVTAGEEELVLRVAPPRDTVFLFYERDMIRQEPGIHRLLLERTTVPVAPIVAFDDTHEVVDRDFILMGQLFNGFVHYQHLIGRHFRDQL